jgi:predicted ATPase
MRINRAEIKNFTVFKDISIDFDNGVNVIIGENGTGKTHLLKLLYAFCNCNYEKNNISKDMVLLMTTYFNNNGNLDLFYNSQDLIKFTFYTPGNKKGFNLNIRQEQFEGANYPVWNLIFDKYMLSSIYIPSKDMLTHSKGLLEMTKKYRKDMPFDKTLLDIIEKSRQWKLDEIPLIAKNIIPKLENIIEGKIIFENDTFFVQKSNGKKINFSLEAEGIKKIGLLWQLLMNDSINNDTILFWDEPEANINPKLIPDLVEIILELSRNGVQIFIATHDYILAKYFEVKRKENDAVRFHSLYKTDEGVKCDSNINFRDLNNNSIIIAFDELMDEVIDRNMGD